jgi:hypothetical protein
MWGGYAHRYVRAAYRGLAPSRASTLARVWRINLVALSSNHAMQPTAGRRTAEIFMTSTSAPAATRALIRSRCSLPLRAVVYVMAWPSLPFAIGG